MKKFIALVLSIVLACRFSVTAFAAESPTADSKVTITIRKSDFVGFDGKSDVKYTVDDNSTITVKNNSSYGKFNSWSFYKVANSVEAVEGVDYEIVSGTVNSQEMTIKVKTSLIVCANYNDVKTEPLSDSNTDNSSSAPQTADYTVVYAVLSVLAASAFVFGVKKVYSK